MRSARRDQRMPLASQAVTTPIISGAEPWFHPGGSHGVLVLHGFTGNPQSMRPLAEAVAAAGFTVDLPLLPGHGTAVDEMVPTRWDDWSGGAEAAYQALATRCDKVAVAGLSMGGTLTCWLAERHPEIAGIAVINPMVDPPTAEFTDGIRSLLEAGTEVIDGIGSDIAKEGVEEAAYPQTPLAAALSLFEGVEAGPSPARCHRLPHPPALQPPGPRGRPGVRRRPRAFDRGAHRAGLPRAQFPRGHARLGRPADRGAGGGVRRPGPRAARARRRSLMAGPERLTRAEVAHVAALARLDLTEDELDLFTGQLAQVLDHAADVASLDLAGVPMTAHAMAVTNVLRPDEVRTLPRP